MKYFFRQHIQIHVQILQNEPQLNNNVSVLKNICDHVCLDRNHSGIMHCEFVRLLRMRLNMQRILVLRRDKGNKCSGNLIKRSG